MDNGPQHFRTYEWLHAFFCFSEDFNKKKIDVDLNYFTEYHGKCICDAHFSLLSRYYDNRTKQKKNGEAVYDTKGYIKILQEAILSSNQTTLHKNSKMKNKCKTKEPFVALRRNNVFSV